ncbi:MAG: hypothetical protein FWC60_06165 [Firmicutes bacterium]|nr:hypothetical protein [Bacillota bacterium]
MIRKARARKTVNRKGFLGEHERTVNGFAYRSMLSSNGRKIITVRPGFLLLDFH